MAATTEARRLTEAHRLGQQRIAARVVRQMFAAWPLLDPTDLDATLADWLRVTVPLIQTQRRASALLSSNYLAAYRAAELGLEVAQLAPVLAGPAPLEQLVTSLTVTAPARIKAATGQGVRLTRAAETARTSSARAATRHALDGGRATVTDAVAADRKALGWARATSASPCSFCALIAGRGPVYKSSRTARFQPHDGCSCMPEPVFHRDADWPPGSRRYADVYAEAKAADGDTLKNFRGLIEAA
jgi:hypothetical protein